MAKSTIKLNKVIEKSEKSEIIKEEPKAEEKEEEMAQFLFTKQTTGTAVYTGASGEKYVINRRLPFKVKNKQDIEFFSKQKQRFKRVIIPALSKKPEFKDQDVLFGEELDKIKEISKETKDKLVRSYFNEENIIRAVERGYTLDMTIPPKERKILKEYFLEKRLKKRKGDK